MWCDHCQHDVPDPPKADGTLPDCCSECGVELAIEMDADTSGSTEAAEVELTPMTSAAESAIWSTWELNEQLRHVERVLSAVRPKPMTLDSGDRLRFDPPRRSNRAVADHPRSRSNQHSAMSAVTWLATAIGTVTLACGGVLAGWGWFGLRPELWRFGVPVVLAGQFVLLFGLLARVADLGARVDRPGHSSPGVDEYRDSYASRLNIPR
jgi:hypothetical protein